MRHNEPHPVNASYRNKSSGVKASFVFCLHGQQQSAKPDWRRTFGPWLCCIVLALLNVCFHSSVFYFSDYELSFLGLFQMALQKTQRIFTVSFWSHVVAPTQENIFSHTFAETLMSTLVCKGFTIVWWSQYVVCWIYCEATLHIWTYITAVLVKWGHEAAAG